MNKTSAILSIEPGLAIPGGEITVVLETAVLEPADIECMFDGVAGEISAASSRRLMVKVPDGISGTEVSVSIWVDGQEGPASPLFVGSLLCESMHLVANPAVDPEDGSVVMTRSGSRGQRLPATLFRYRDGEVEELPSSVMNPTGIAFDQEGKLFVTNRADGEVLQINPDGSAIPIATGLGVATGIAFDADGEMHIGDRGGVIYKISGIESAYEWARLEPSVSAFHMAFGPDGCLYVAAPGLCSHDVIHRIFKDGARETFYKGLGRPQGLAFDQEGRLYAAACMKGRHGIIRISRTGDKAEFWLAAMNAIGLCFDLEGGVVVATSESLYRFEAGIYGTLAP